MPGLSEMERLANLRIYFGGKGDIILNEIQIDRIQFSYLVHMTIDAGLTIEGS